MRLTVGEGMPALRQARVDESLVFAKTARGAAEVSARGAGLSLTERRLLILVDGRRSVQQLAPVLRPGEIEIVLERLEALGLVVRVAGEFEEPVTPTQGFDQRYGNGLPDVPMESVEDRQLVTLETAKRRAVRELNERLGPDAETMAIRIEHCRSVEELRERMREAERLVAGFVGEHAAQEFVRALRRR